MENSKRMRLFVEDLVAHGLAAAITIGFSELSYTRSPERLTYRTLPLRR